MKIYYLNDTKKNHIVHNFNLVDPGTLIMPGEGKAFEVDISENQIPFIKIWETGVVLITGMDKK